MPLLSCRYYKNKFPEVEDVVMVNVKSIAEMGAYVDLSEYNNIEGMILLSELSRRRIRSINKLIRIGKSECVVVIRVDKEKGYIDLSKRLVLPEDIIACEDRFSKAKIVNSILRHVAEIRNYQTDEQLEELYDKTAWYFDEKMKKKGAAYEVFKGAVNEPSILDECKIDDETKKVLLSYIRRRLMPQAVKARADIEVSCYGYEGIDGVKTALNAGRALSTAEQQVKINLITPPQYVLTTQTLDKESGIALLQKAIDEIERSIKEQGGSFNVIQAPKLVTEVDEVELAKRLDKLREENEEVPGDDDDEGDAGSDDAPVED